MGKLIGSKLIGSKLVYNRYVGELWLWMIFLEWIYDLMYFKKKEVCY
jgi:hypothetical protein